MYRWFAYIIIFILLPSTAQAAVLINEVAWMGTSESHYCEWVELYNDSSEAVDISKWSFKIADNANAFAEGEGKKDSLPANSYLLIERVTNSCPDPVPQEEGLYLAFGDLPNGGATLSLLRSDGSLEDKVTGGEDWQNIGGDNDSKATAQRTPGGWSTGEATPGSKNNSTSEESNDNESASSQTSEDEVEQSAKQNSNEDADANQLQQSTEELILKLDVPKTGYVNKEISFSVKPEGTNEVVRNSLKYSWNFGDATEAVGKETSHTYVRPGTYVVTLFASFATREVLARQEITILPITAEITRADNGDIQLHNSSPYDLDLSGYELAGDREVVFPAHSLLAAKETLTIPRKRLETDSFGYVALYNQSGDLVASNYEEIKPKIDKVQKPEGPAVEDKENTPVAEVKGVSTTTANTLSNKSPTGKTNEQLSWYAKYWEYLALALLVLAAIFLFVPINQDKKPDKQM